MPKLGANDMPEEVAEDMWANGFHRGFEEGFQAGFNDALIQIREALYKLYGNSMKSIKENEDDKRKQH